MDKVTISKYEDIYKRAQDIISNFKMSVRECKEFILRQRKENEDGMCNTLIECPQNIKRAFKETYLDHGEALSGPIGVTKNGGDQYDGIIQMSTLVLLANRVSKQYIHEKKQIEEKRELTDNEKKDYRQKIGNAYLVKENTLSDLIANLYVLDRTDEENNNSINYGDREDKEGNGTFVIDIPCIGQVSVHYGHLKGDILEDAKNKAKSILIEKEKEGQISKEQLDILTSEVETEILPEYEGQLYEYVSAIPLEYKGSKIKEIQQKLGISGKMPEDITDEDITRIQQKSGLNKREIHYMGVRLEFPKRLLLDLELSPKERQEAREKAKNDKANVQKIPEGKIKQSKGQALDNTRKAYTNAKINNSDIQKANTMIRNVQKDRQNDTKEAR